MLTLAFMGLRYRGLVAMLVTHWYSRSRGARSGSARALWAMVFGLAGLGALGGCATSNDPAPVESRSISTRGPTVASTQGAKPSDAAKPLPGAENAGKPGYYSVRPGDTLIHIALAYGQTHKDLARWNGLDNPNKIEVGQVLRVVPPGAENGVLARPVAAASSGIEVRPLDAKARPRPDATADASAGPASAASASSAASAAVAKPLSEAAATPSKPVEVDINWRWPSDASLLGSFDEKKGPGVYLASKTGDPVLAAADGRVSMVTDAPRGYFGKIVGITHQGGFVSVYTNIQNVAVQENATIRQGQKVAEVGPIQDDERKRFYFVISKDAKRIDPSKLLPAR
jgi:lipoprotein NlpD